MELALHYFWAIKLALLALGLFTAYKAITVHRLKSRLWNTLAILAFLVFMFNPIKLYQPMDHNLQQRHIEQAKVLPPKVVDKSFEESKNLKGISREDIWDSTN